MGKLERKVAKAREERGGEYEAALLARIEELEGKNQRLATALNSDVEVIKQAGDVIQMLGEKVTNYEKVLKAHGLMTFDGRMTVIQ